MFASRLSHKYQAIIPLSVRKILDLHEGDLLGFDVHDKEVVIRKITPLDLEFSKSLEKTLSEWSSEEDDKLYANL